MQISVRSSDEKCSGAHKIHLRSQVSLRSVSGQSQVSLRSLCAYFVRQTEPKILRLVIYIFIFHCLLVILILSIWYCPLLRFPLHPVIL